jgi:hypothetical protein
MLFESQNESSPKCDVSLLPGSGLPKHWGLIVVRLAVVLLLFGLAGLATVAKDGQYYPTANPARQVSLSTKMNLAHAPVLFTCGPLENVARLVVPKPRPIFRRRTEAELLPIRSIGLTQTLRFRPPPAVLS